MRPRSARECLEFSLEAVSAAHLPIGPRTMTTDTSLRLRHRRFDIPRLRLLNLALVLLLLDCGGKTTSEPGQTTAGAPGTSGTPGAGGAAGLGGNSGTGGTTNGSAGSGGGGAGGTGGFPYAPKCEAWINGTDNGGKQLSQTLGCGNANEACPPSTVCCVHLCTVGASRCFPEDTTFDGVDCFTPGCTFPAQCVPGGTVTPQ